MVITEKEWERLNKRVADLEKQIQSQPEKQEKASRKIREQLRESFESYKRLISKKFPY